MKHLNRRLGAIIFLAVCMALCSSLMSCKKYDDIMLNFYRDTSDDKFNAIEIDLGNNNSATYFIKERYGIWLNQGEQQLFSFEYVPVTHGGGALMIHVPTQQSYYESMVQRNDGLASFYYGKKIFSGSCEFSDDETVATISPDTIDINEMFVDSEHTVVMTKTRISDEDIVPLNVALRDMNFVPDAYYDFIAKSEHVKFSCEAADFWVDGSSMIGEWNTNGAIVPIKMKIHEEVPYIEIYDISESEEKVILMSYARVVDDSQIELVNPGGELFYAEPSAPVMITKTN